MITVTHTYAGNFIIPPPIPNLRSKGVPPGGPADPFLSALALHLAQSDTCLEITTPITLTSDQPTQIALAAPPNSQTLSHHPTASLALLPLFPNQPLTINAPKSGYRLYLSWSGLTAPSQFPKLLATEATFLTLSTEAFLLVFDVLHVDTSRACLDFIPSEEYVDSSWLLCKTTPHISRIGTRLEISPYHELRREAGEIDGHTFRPLARSEPSLHGAVQVTPDRQLLIHGPDGPILGGYPKIGAIIQSSLPDLAQLRPGQVVALSQTTVEEATQLRTDHKYDLEGVLMLIDQALMISGHKS